MFDVLDALLQFVKYDESALEQCVTVPGRLDTLRTAMRSRTPSPCSRSAMTSDTVGVETPSCAAALAMLPRWATVENTCRSRSRSRRPIWLSQSIFLKH